MGVFGDLVSPYKAAGNFVHKLMENRDKPPIGMIIVPKGNDVQQYSLYEREIHTSLHLQSP